MPDKRCPNGHFIDASWDLCPYCPHDKSAAATPEPTPKTVGTARSIERLNRPPADPSVERAPVAGAVQSDPPQRTVVVSKAGQEAAAGANRYVVGWLVGIDSAARGESFAIRTGRNVIGRDRRSDIPVTDEQASAHHADLVYRPDERRYILMDHNSTNGTFVNGVELEQRRDLAGRDIIRIGTQSFLFVPLCDEEMYWDGKGLLK